MLNGLGLDFDMLITSIEGNDSLHQFFALHARLLNREARRQTTSSPASSALIASQSPRSVASPAPHNFRGRGRNSFVAKVVLAFVGEVVIKVVKIEILHKIRCGLKYRKSWYRNRERKVLPKEQRRLCIIMYNDYYGCTRA